MDDDVFELWSRTESLIDAVSAARRVTPEGGGKRAALVRVEELLVEVAGVLGDCPSRWAQAARGAGQAAR